MTADTKYPILMLHGMGFRDTKLICYWGRIPKVLRQNGACVYYGNQDSNGTIQSNEEQIRISLDNILSETGAEKVNIIAHSKGGLDARYLISSMGYGDKIATLTTMSTPHNGSFTIDKLMSLPNWLVRSGCAVADVWFRILGDKHPSTYSAIFQLRTDSAKIFNRNTPDDPQVFYQSYGFVMKNAFSDLLICIPWLIVHGIDGENDGLFSPRGVRWTNFRGVYTGTGRRGISHCDEVDMRRRRCPLICHQNKYDDITSFYLKVVEDLKNS